MRNSQLYEQDFYAWVNEQVALLRAGRLAEAASPDDGLPGVVRWGRENPPRFA